MILISSVLMSAGIAPPPDAAVLAISLVGATIAVALDLACMRACLEDLSRHAIVLGGNKQFWTLLIVLGGPLGQAAYWLYGRGPY
jgi:hypothetical protein